MGHNLGQRPRTTGGRRESRTRAGLTRQPVGVRQAWGRLRGARQHWHPLDARVACRPQGRDQLVTQALLRGRRAGIRLEHQLHGAQFQGPDRRGRTRAAVGTDHHHGTRHLGHDVPDRVHPVELRHLEVQGDQVGLVQMNLAQGIETVAGSADDSELAACLHQVGQQPPEKRAVVHDQHRRKVRADESHDPPR
jgi:hypothetical protein